MSRSTHMLPLGLFTVTVAKVQRHLWHGLHARPVGDFFQRPAPWLWDVFTLPWPVESRQLPQDTHYPWKSKPSDLVWSSANKPSGKSLGNLGNTRVPVTASPPGWVNHSMGCLETALCRRKLVNSTAVAPAAALVEKIRRIILDWGLGVAATS
ncbi:hypothetical protein DFH08DRAFT_808247 [Mycena albidolilacea]|uniref:Uncharacterized protein n=1 Tax=Mycena albidolilacea TaxID=1033008 RepID=A0AAD7A3Y1_9AGAR|nr:hypothetical protein DFH08DRAFT_808247 [Mycena albidolilacea]